MMKQKTEQQRTLELYIGKRLSELRLNRGVTCEEMANELGCSVQLYHKFENGASELSTHHLYACATILGVEPDFFFKEFSDAHTIPFSYGSRDDRIIQPSQTTPLTVLVVEDDASDAYLMERALKASSIPVQTYLVSDGEEALSFLHGKIASPFSLQPDLILVDLNMPKKDGLSLLRAIKGDPKLCLIPVVIVSNSLDFNEMHTCYAAFASGFICKSFDFVLFRRHIDMLLHYWARCVVLPRQRSTLNV